METPCQFEYCNETWDLDYDNAIFLCWDYYKCFYQYMQVPCIISYIIIIIAGVIGNSLVIWVARFKMKSTSSVWYLNLAVTDFISNMALTLRIMEWYQKNNFYLSKYVCTASAAFLFFNMLTSVYFLTVISIDRCVSIMWPLWAKVHRTPRLARVISLIIWVVGLIITSPHVAFYILLDNVSECYPKYINKIPNQWVYVILTTKLAAMFAVPFLVILICYCLIAFKLRTLKHPTGSRKPLKLITSLVVCFFVCWFPYNVWPLIILNGSYWKTDIIISEVSACLAYTNSCINPILYVFFCRDFKENFTKFLPARLKNVFKDKRRSNHRESR